VDWLTDRHYFLLAVIVYGVSTLYSVFLWRKGFRHHDRINYLLLLLGFLAHITAMLKRGFDLKHCPINNLYEATLFVAWTIVAAYLVFGLWSRLRFLSVFASPVLFGMGVFALMPALDPPHGVHPQFVGGGASLHGALILLAYGAFGLGSVAALMYLTQEHDLKFHKLRAVFSLLPPIQRLELVAHRLALAGFILLTAGLYVGSHLARPAGVHYFQDAKVVWSIFLWLLYLTLLVLRRRFALTGRRFAWGIIGTFVFVLLTFWGTNLLSTLHNP
jgi:HemX protein